MTNENGMLYEHDDWLIAKEDVYDELVQDLMHACANALNTALLRVGGLNDPQTKKRALQMFWECMSADDSKFEEYMRLGAQGFINRSIEAGDMRVLKV